MEIIYNYCFQKNKHHSELIKLEIEKDNLNKENNKKSEEANNSNINIESNFIIIIGPFEVFKKFTS